MKKLLTLLASACLVIVVVPVVGHAAAAYPCFGMKATIVGTPGNDVIHGTHGTDVIRGLGGNDKIFAGGRSDYICGGRGADKIHADKASPTNYGRVGNDRMSGGRGHDRLMGEGMNDWGAGDHFLGDLGDDHITEGRYMELLRLGRFSEYIFNVVDYSQASAPVSAVLTERYPEASKMTLTGDGNDTIDFAGIGAFWASPYDDHIDMQGFIQSLSSMGGNDHIVYDGGSSDSLSSGDEDDTITFVNGGTVNIGQIHAGDGNDTIEGVMDSAPVDAGPGDDILINDEDAFGGDGNDTMIAGAHGSGRHAYDFSLAGGNGADTITGGPGSDILGGGPGDDTINGQDGISGNDTIDGGAGTDACTFDQGDTVLNCP